MVGGGNGVSEERRGEERRGEERKKRRSCSLHLRCGDFAFGIAVLSLGPGYGFAVPVRTSL
jgi:hypothetical protein